MDSQKFYLYEKSKKISQAENRYDFLPEVRFCAKKTGLNNLCRIAAKNIVEAKINGKDTKRIEVFLKEYRNYICANLD